MNGWDHLLITTLLFIFGWVFIAVFFPFWSLPANFSFWLILVAWVGGLFPDFDTHWKPILGHRSVITHSVLAPLLIVGLFFLPLYYFGQAIILDRYFISVFLLACGGHLLLDLAPSSRSVINRWLKNPLVALAYIEKGRKAPPGNITLIPKKYERAWLIINGLILIATGIALWIVLPNFLP